jgi:nucleoside-diphosphate-sugar epimerase
MNGDTLLLTGSTGALGPPILAALLAREAFERIYLLIRPETESLENRITEVIDGLRLGGCDTAIIDANVHRLIPIAGNVTNPIEFDADVDVVIHAAADTRFRAPRDEQARFNVGGTQNVIAWAKRCKNLKRFVHVSSICVAGQNTGRISETRCTIPPGFTNDYESSKWQAEQLVFDSGLPATVARVSLVIGSDRNGSVHRPGAVHHALRWMYRGLIPMIPGTEHSVVDLISSELAANCLADLATRDDAIGDVVHIAAGDRAIPLSDLLDVTMELFSKMSPAWRQGQIAKPMIVDAETFELFRDSVHRSGDVLFRSVLDSVSSFLPGLLYPKVYDTRCAERAFGGMLPLSNWRPLIQRVISQCITGDGKRILPREVCLA